MQLKLLTAALTIVLSGNLAIAAQVVYFDRDDDRSTDLADSKAARDAFLATLYKYGTESFEEQPGAFSPTLTFSPGHLEGVTNSGFVAPFLPVTGIFALVDFGPGIPGYPGGTAPFDDSFQLDHLVSAFGLFISNGGDDANDTTLTIKLTNTIANTSKNVVLELGPGWQQPNGLFIGITDTDQFDLITMIETGSPGDVDGMLYDDIIAGYVLPEPSSLTLLGCGLLGVGLVIRKRQARQAA